MKFFFKLCVLAGCLMLSHGLSAKQWVKSYAWNVYAGPEIYQVRRTTENGSRQKGTLYGGRIGYEYLQRYKLYSGIDALWARGTLEGHSPGQERIKSKFTDINVEARIGFTFQSQSWRCASFTPYIGGGYFWENNCFEHPTPLTIHFKNRFSYIPMGFLSQIFITPQWSLGANFKVRVIVEGEQHVAHDAEFGKHTQHYDEKLQYRAELPVSYFFCWNMQSLGISVVPFYEYRHYGHRANFPFDFFETKFRLYGATLKLLYLF